MKKVFYLVVVICLVLGLIGCTDVSTDRIQTPIISTPTPDSDKEALEKIMEERNIKYFGKDIEYNIPNMLDKEFIVVGYAELSDYYNYGFDDLEEHCFCIKIKPKFDTSNNDWYIYLDREDFNRVYDDLIEKNQCLL
ncbi:MAG: hypothetical protein GYA02_09545 [Clostridiaceae bacterium]|nr:hypothetical protein [Clostridiaceae bacterium]